MKTRLDIMIEIAERNKIETTCGGVVPGSWRSTQIEYRLGIISNDDLELMRVHGITEDDLKRLPLFEEHGHYVQL